MPVTVTLASPGHLDLQALADATRLSVELLKPWTVEATQSENTVVAKVAKQAARYADTIQLTVSAAYSGYTVTTDVLCLAEMLRDPKANKREADRYVAGLLTLARESKAKATKAFDSLREIRKELMKLQQEFLPQLETYNTELRQSGDERELSRLFSGVNGDLETLQKFSDQVSLFINWWDWAQTETDPSRERQPIEYQLDSLRDSGTIARWEEMKMKYMSYARIMANMQNADPDFFHRSSTDGIEKQPSTSLARVTQDSTMSSQTQSESGSVWANIIHSITKWTTMFPSVGNM